MRTFTTVLCLCVSSVVGFGTGDLEQYGPFSLYIYSIKCTHNKTLNLDVSGIRVYFYDFSKSNTFMYNIKVASTGILSYPRLDKNMKFIIFVSGYKSNILKPIEEQVKNTFKDIPKTYLILFDHSLYTNDKHGMVNSYQRSVKHVYYIGKAIAEFLIGLRQGGISENRMHCVGYSLGSQILGHVGDVFYQNTGVKLWRITALDPAGPCFSNSLIQEQVRSGVAQYVEVYHCNAGGLGTTAVLGDIDFFVNKKGRTQPKCGTPLIPGFYDSSKAARCNHRACINIWLASAKNPQWYPATRCEEYDKFKSGDCASNNHTVAGYWNPGDMKGIFYFSTEEYIQLH